MSEDNVLRHEIASLDKDLLVASKEIATLHSQLAASQERERILREGLGAIYDLRAPDYREGYQPFEVGDYEQGVLTGKDDAADIAREYIQKAEEVNGCTGK